MLSDGFLSDGRLPDVSMSEIQTDAGLSEPMEMQPCERGFEHLRVLRDIPMRCPRTTTTDVYPVALRRPHSTYGCMAVDGEQGVKTA